MAEDTCWIKDEHGRFMGRRPGCKMEKSGGVREISDKKTNDDEVASDAALEEEAKAHGKSVEDYKKEKRAMEILRKPQSQWTEDDKRFLKDYDSLEANPAGNPVDAIAFALAGPMAGIARTVLGNIAMDITMEKLTKYAEENFPGYGAIGVVLAGIALALTKGKSGAAAEEKAAAAVAEEKASAAVAEKSAAEEAERKAAAEAERKAAAEAEEKVAAAVAEEKAAEETAKREAERGKIYDDAANGSSLSKSDAEKKANKLITGDVSADEAKRVNAEAQKKGVTIDITGYKTEASQYQIEHSIRGHSDAKVEIAKAREARGDTVNEKDKIPENDIKGKAGKHNVPLKKEDYQNIEKYRKDAVNPESPTKGRVVFQPAKGEKKFESVDYQVRKDGEVIHTIYKVDPVNNKLTFVTMYKETERKPPEFR